MKVKQIACEAFDAQREYLDAQLRDKEISFSQWLQLKLRLGRSHDKCSHYEEGKRLKLATSQLEFVL